jgi:hypothetical protein
MAGTAAPPREADAQHAAVSSFSKALMLGEIHEQLVSHTSGWRRR